MTIAAPRLPFDRTACPGCAHWLWAAAPINGRLIDLGTVDEQTWSTSGKENAGLWIWDLSCGQPSPQHEVAHTGPRIHTHTEHRSSLQNQSHTSLIYKVRGLKLCLPLLPSLDFIYKSSIHVYLHRTIVVGFFCKARYFHLKATCVSFCYT